MYSGRKSNLLEQVQPHHPHHDHLLHQQQLYQHEQEMEEAMMLNNNHNKQKERGVREPLSVLLTSDAKPRLRWTNDLHERFVEAVMQLGGPITIEFTHVDVLIGKAPPLKIRERGGPRKIDKRSKQNMTYQRNLL
ncbi:hypothetical protein AQUCO_00500363v1 [Aquilegia coerulea]|uniref:Uncharacterized protein n=1 Tax=Aquilegia coerulea TaxID=218851 RepID=A0A2G5ERU4_AQUCA|nr:hypothetical protein AQUCO_00500363v1 [Aquilegia coerulea]